MSFVLAGLLISPALSRAAEPLPAFPGAEGFGAATPGGRGGQVLLVTSLDDYVPGREPPVPGSFRAACETTGKRFILFRASGTITLKAPLRIREPFVTIAGQTDPPPATVFASAGRKSASTRTTWSFATSGSAPGTRPAPR